MEADGPANTKTRKRTEDAATAFQAMHEDGCSADRVDPDPMCSTSSGDDCTGPPAPPCSGENALVDNRAAAHKSCPILGDALTNSRWWHTSHRRSLYSYEDHFQSATSSVLLDREDGFKDGFENSASIPLVRQQFLACCPILPEGHRNKIRRK